MKTNWLDLWKSRKPHATGGIEVSGMWWSDEEAFLTDCIGFCGCGAPELSLRYIARKLKEIDARSFHPGGYTAENYFFWYWAESAGLTEHGGAVPGWLTADGKELIAAIDAIPGEDDSAEEG